MRGPQDKSRRLPVVSPDAADAYRPIDIDLASLLAAGWTLRQIEERLDLIENCRRMHRNSTTQPNCWGKPAN